MEAESYTDFKAKLELCMANHDSQTQFKFFEGVTKRIDEEENGRCCLHGLEQDH